MGVLLDNVPWWSQLKDVIPQTGQPDTFARSDCGEECVCMLLWYWQQKYLREDQVRSVIPGHAGHGETTGSDLAYALQWYNLEAQAMNIGAGKVREWAKAELTKERPVLVLGRWIDPSVLHWYLLLGFGNGAAVAMDPWSGEMKVLAWSVVQSLATGDVVQCQP